jgi:hypothetical protein
VRFEFSRFEAYADLSSSSMAYANACDFRYLLQAKQRHEALQWELIDHTQGNDMVSLNLIL